MLHWKATISLAAVGVLAALAAVGGFGWTWY
jgi:hypothetical protein